MALCILCGKREARTGTGPDKKPWVRCTRCLNRGTTEDPDPKFRRKSNFGPDDTTHIQCTATARSGKRCKGIAVTGTPSQVCRMHGGTALVGPEASNFKHGRYSRYLPSQMASLFEEALANPDLLEMSDHIALLESRIQSILQASTEGDPVPKWGDVALAFSDLKAVIGSGEEKLIAEQVERFDRLLKAGIKWDTTWMQVTDNMEQLRKMADTEVKRKKELNQMVPIERIIVLMAAVGSAVKRNVSNPNEIIAVQRELATLIGTDKSGMHRRTDDTFRAGPEMIDVRRAKTLSQ